MCGQLSLLEMLPLIYFGSIAGKFQTDTGSHLLQFVVGMLTFWNSVTLLFLLLTKRCIRKTLHSSGLHSWWFKWRSVPALLLLFICTHVCLLQTQCWCLYSGPLCPLGTCVQKVHALIDLTSAREWRLWLPSGSCTIFPCFSPMYYLLMPSPNTAVDS